MPMLISDTADVKGEIFQNAGLNHLEISRDVLYVVAHVALTATVRERGARTR
jgi:hypothetical protein